ncbi:MAG: DUF1564 family protein [Spirochaetales bacterium]|nr:DUF1564 family protein [Leptospiraceae bacterium]MCP5481609.1 DUF1564 family protein [Spirochaetales bacterium]MCP5484437.1 DUF1564 family protein [Spirochaetales bacterium]
METMLEWKSRATQPGSPACTLLIPESLVRYLRKRKRSCGGVVKYLRLLLSQVPAYRRAGLLPKVERTTRYYQRSGLGLDKWHVRIPAHHWTELRCLAGGCGVTMTHMFVILMKVEKSGKAKKWKGFKRGTGDRPTFRWLSIGFWEARVEENQETERHVMLVAERGPP